MKFQYKKFAPGYIRPIIPITLNYKKMSIKYEALVDSGADICAFPGQIGELLGIDVRNGKEGPLRGVTGKDGKIFYHKISITIGGNNTNVRAGFSYNMNANIGFLGQVGIFNLYIVKFHYRKGLVELKPDLKVN